MIDFPAAHVAQVADEVAVSAVTIAELQYGVSVAPDPLTQMHRRRRVQATLDRFEVLSFDVAAAEYYGMLAALVRQYGRIPQPRRRLADRRDRSAPRPDTPDPKRRRFAGVQSALEVVDLPNRIPPG